MYRALFTADWHLSNRLPYSKAMSGMDGITDRLLEQMVVIRQIIKAAKESDVDAVYILGDVFDKRSLDAIVLKSGAQLISELIEVVPSVFIMVGNHDVYSLTSNRSVNEFFDFIGDGVAEYIEPETVIDTRSTLNEKGDSVRFHVLPWCSLDIANKRLESMLKAKNADNSEYLDVLLLHHSVKGAVDRNWVSEDGLDPEWLCDNWDLILSGHFHNGQTFGGNGHYVSAPMQHDFGDEGSEGVRGYFIATFDKTNYTLEFKETTHPRFYSIKYSDYLSGSKEYIREWNKHDYVRFDISCTHAELKLLKPEIEEEEGKLARKGVRVIPYRFVPKTQHDDRIEITESATTNEIVSKYLDVASYEGLDRDRLLAIAIHALKEVENG